MEDKASDGNHPGRTLAWIPRGFTWCRNPQHVADSITLMGLSSESRGSSTPASKGTGKNMCSAIDVLPNERAELFRKAAGTALYFAIDRPSVQFAMDGIISGMSTSTVVHWAKLHCLAQYMQHHRIPKMLEVLTDTDWAADTETLKSVPCTIERLGGHSLGCSVAKENSGCVDQWRERVLRDREGRCLWRPDTPTALPAWCTCVSI